MSQEQRAAAEAFGSGRLCRDLGPSASQEPPGGPLPAGVPPSGCQEDDPHKGFFLPWKLALNFPLTLPHTKRKNPFEDYEVGKMKPGITNLSDPDYDSLADWYARGDILEVRIPWTMLGYTDPSTLRV